jgi:glutathione S-transferase
LADPAATPNQDLIPALDLILRFVANSLLEKTRSKSWMLSMQVATNESQAEMLNAAIDNLDGETKHALARCLDYVRERIGVPRDMAYPAAQELRMTLLDMRQLILSKIPQSKAAKSELVLQ